MLLRDFDCDGLPDLFTGYQNSIHVYRNTTAAPGVPTFEPYALPLTASWDFGTGTQELPLVCLTIDKPAIFDVDNDGDLDFICFTETSTSLYRFSGQSACGLDLVCTNRCYGMVSEGSEDNTLFIGADHNCSFNVVDPEGRPAPIEAEAAERDGVHAGGAITALQFDGENFHDLLISDVTYPTMSGLMLEDAIDGQDSTAWVDMAFPALVPHAGEADSIVLERFPAAYPIDPDADGDWDLVISPNIALEINGDQCVQLWENQGTTDEPLWALASDHWIQDGTIDVGRGAIPVLHDLDGDGDLDLAIGNKERYEGVNDTPTALALYENTGTATQPTYEWRTWSVIDFAFNGIESGHPAFGDLDGDGDKDLIVGDELGLLHAYINTAEPGSWPAWTLDQLAVEDAEGEAIDVGQFAAPQLIDVNADDLVDLVIGEKNGTLCCTSTAALPQRQHGACKPRRNWRRTGAAFKSTTPSASTDTPPHACTWMAQTSTSPLETNWARSNTSEPSIPQTSWRRSKPPVHPGTRRCGGCGRVEPWAMSTATASRNWSLASKTAGCGGSMAQRSTSQGFEL